MSIWTLFVKIWRVCNHEFNVNFIPFLGLYHFLFYIESIGVSQTITWWLVFEKKPISILAGNLNSRLSYLITIVILGTSITLWWKCWLCLTPVKHLQPEKLWVSYPFYHIVVNVRKIEPIFAYLHTFAFTYLIR